MENLNEPFNNQEFFCLKESLRKQIEKEFTSQSTQEKNQSPFLDKLLFQNAQKSHKLLELKEELKRLKNKTDTSFVSTFETDEFFTKTDKLQEKLRRIEKKQQLEEIKSEQYNFMKERTRKDLFKAKTKLEQVQFAIDKIINKNHQTKTIEVKADSNLLVTHSEFLEFKKEVQRQRAKRNLEISSRTQQKKALQNEIDECLSRMTTYKIHKAKTKTTTSELLSKFQKNYELLKLSERTAHENALFVSDSQSKLRVVLDIVKAEPIDPLNPKNIQLVISKYKKLSSEINSIENYYFNLSKQQKDYLKTFEGLYLELLELKEIPEYTKMVTKLFQKSQQLTGTSELTLNQLITTIKYQSFPKTKLEATKYESLTLKCLSYILQVIQNVLFKFEAITGKLKTEITQTKEFKTMIASLLGKPCETDLTSLVSNFLNNLQSRLSKASMYTKDQLKSLYLEFFPETSCEFFVDSICEYLVLKLFLSVCNIKDFLSRSESLKDNFPELFSLAFNNFRNHFLNAFSVLRNLLKSLEEPQEVTFLQEKTTHLKIPPKKPKSKSKTSRPKPRKRTFVLKEDYEKFIRKIPSLKKEHSEQRPFEKLTKYQTQEEITESPKKEPPQSLQARSVTPNRSENLPFISLYSTHGRDIQKNRFKQNLMVLQEAKKVQNDIDKIKKLERLSHKSVENLPNIKKKPRTPRFC